jgi:hypothetical protein
MNSDFTVPVPPYSSVPFTWSLALLAGYTPQLILLQWYQIEICEFIMPVPLVLHLRPLHAPTVPDTLTPKADAPDTYKQSTLLTDLNPMHLI